MYSLETWERISENYDPSVFNGGNNGPCDIGLEYRGKFGPNVSDENPFDKLPDNPKSSLVFFNKS